MSAVEAGYGAKQPIYVLFSPRLAQGESELMRQSCVAGRRNFGSSRMLPVPESAFDEQL